MVLSYGLYLFCVLCDCVFVEEVLVEFLFFEYLLLMILNCLIFEDFDGWVQECGFYFFNEWDDCYEVLLVFNDFGELLCKGGIFYVCYGEGVYIYMGYLFFCELLGGVLGVY